jgi:YidC/Oxa1 family membrane protein insertase
MLGFLFSKLKADVFIMTMPDLGNYLFKRSTRVGIYIYIFHAAVSTHQQYNKEAFFNYDAIFCIGNYQNTEIRAVEKRYELPQKELISYGYPLLDELAIKKESSSIAKPAILIAPSWFNGCIFDTCIEELLKRLSELNYSIILRSHPEYEKRKKKEFNRIKQLVQFFPQMEIDKMPDVTERLATTDILITDRSGIALEFAFGMKRPVLFIDTALKINNADYDELGIEPLENSIRNQIGISISPDNLNQLSNKLKELEFFGIDFSSKAEKLSKELFYNSDESYQKGVEYILGKIKKD